MSVQSRIWLVSHSYQWFSQVKMTRAFQLAGGLHVNQLCDQLVIAQPVK